MSLTSPGVSQWTVNENSYGTQTTQTDHYWSTRHGDSFDSCKSYSTGEFNISSIRSIGFYLCDHCFQAQKSPRLSEDIIVHVAVHRFGALFASIIIITTAAAALKCPKACITRLALHSKSQFKNCVVRCLIFGQIVSVAARAM